MDEYGFIKLEIDDVSMTDVEFDFIFQSKSQIVSLVLFEFKQQGLFVCLFVWNFKNIIIVYKENTHNKKTFF